MTKTVVTMNISMSEQELDRAITQYQEKCEALSELVGTAKIQLREVEDELCFSDDSTHFMRPIELPKFDPVQTLLKTAALMAEVTTMSTLLSQMGVFDDESDA